MDDFGHHPTAIRETLRSPRCRFASQKVWAVFEPRTNTSRRKVFQTSYAQAFEDADLILIREPPDLSVERTNSARN